MFVSSNLLWEYEIAMLAHACPREENQIKMKIMPTNLYKLQG